LGDLPPGGAFPKEKHMSRAELLVRLQRVQDMPQMQGRNIRSVAAILSIDALQKHVEVCEAQAEKAALKQ
jgi:hypothetical protein